MARIDLFTSERVGDYMSPRNPRASRRRTCREEKSFENDLARLSAKYPSIRDVCDSITWELSHDPRAGTQLADDPSYWILHSLACGNMPPFRVRYCFDDHMVYLWSIEATGEATEEP